MKRRFGDIDGGGGDDSYFVSPTTESTLLIDTGGVDDLRDVGTPGNLGITSAIGANAKLFQYNRFYWADDFYSFNYQNCCVGVVLAYYSSARKTTCSAIYPIFIPKMSVTPSPNAPSDTPTVNPELRTAYLEHLVYYLNLGFTSLGRGTSTYNLEFSSTYWC